MMGTDGFVLLTVFLTTTLFCPDATTQTISCGDGAAAASLAPAPSPGAADVDPSVSFITSSCAFHTLYPRLCSRTLAPYASAVGTSARRLAYAAVDAAERRASDSAALVSRLYGGERPAAGAGSSSSSQMLHTGPTTSSSSPRHHSLAGPLRDCAETMSDSLARLRMSAREMRLMGLRPSGSERSTMTAGVADVDDEFESHLSNVQTWVSAALTDQTTCLDGFDEVLGPGPRPGPVVSSSSPGGAAGRRGADTDPVAAAVRKSVLHVSHMTSNALALINRMDNPGQH